MMPFPAARPPRARLPSSRRSGCGSCRRARFALEICARLLYNQTAEFAGVMELVDVLDSKSSAARRAGSSPATGTTASEEASTVPFPPRGENCTVLASSFLNCGPLRWARSLSVSFLRSLRLLGSMIEP